MDILFGNDNETVSMIIKSSDSDFIRKIYALFKEVPYVTDAEKDKLLNLINTLKPGFSWDDNYTSSEDDSTDDSYSIPSNVILVTRMGFNAKKEEFEHLVNVEMAENSRDIGEAQEKGDLRENAEYKAAMEKQVQLQAQIKKLETELKSARILDITDVKTDKINIGCTVKLKNENNGEEVTYSILGAWDADTEKNIISYQSPMGKALLGKKIDDTASVDFEGSHMNFKVLEISRYTI